jgi:predicted metal-binding membrane protein
VWTLVGIVPLVINAVVPLSTVASTHGGVLVGGSLLLLAVYQRSSFKYRCLQKCRSPLGFLMGYHQPGIRGAIRMSWKHSVFCVGCCWALFAFMVVVGSMNILWMGVIAVVLSLERTAAWGDRLAQAIGTLAGMAGIAIIALALL